MYLHITQGHNFVVSQYSFHKHVMHLFLVFRLVKILNNSAMQSNVTYNHHSVICLLQFLNPITKIAINNLFSHMDDAFNYV